MDVEAQSLQFISQRYNDTALVIFHQEQKRASRELKKSSSTFFQSGKAATLSLPGEKKLTVASVDEERVILRSSICVII